MSSLPNSESALEKFVEKIDFTKLEGNPEDFYKTGLAFVENGQFDDGIIEFVKVIKTTTLDNSLFQEVVKELKSMGFSSADIRLITRYSELEISNIAPQAISSPPLEIEQSSVPPSFWNNRKQKLQSIFYIVVAVFVLTIPYSLYSIFIYPIVIFPVGLIGLFMDTDRYSLLAFPVWAIYIGLSFNIISNNEKKIVSRIYILLIFLLILNIVGCHAVGPSIMEGVH